MSGKIALITGGNRGIGLEFVKYYVQKQYKVYATSRASYDQVKELAAIIPNSQHLQLDTSDESSINALPSKLKSLGVQSVDLLINNAGVLYSDSLDDTKLRETAIQQFAVNALGPLLTTRALLDYLKPGSKVVNITSRMGSVEDNGSGRYYGYRMSKTALNMATKGLSIDLKPKGILVGAIHPGFVQTGMTSGKGDITADDSVSLMAQVVEKLNESNTGCFFGRDGDIIPY
ncbi:hypothetical protein HDV01_001345 [Terramyces sp. JEL0728]|nr:hypothetical protein HDV01_001345 [Terramyces sp. JEL0728]